MRAGNCSTSCVWRRRRWRRTRGARASCAASCSAPCASSHASRQSRSPPPTRPPSDDNDTIAFTLLLLLSACRPALRFLDYQSSWPSPSLHRARELFALSTPALRPCLVLLICILVRSGLARILVRGGGKIKYYLKKFEYFKN